MTNHNAARADGAFEILLVEDNPGDVRLLEEAFEATGRETRVESVTNGDEAVDRLMEQATDESRSVPDLALVDLNLPGRDGCEVLDAVRDDSRTELLPIVILTSSSAHEDVERCYAARANAYVTKPTDPAELESLISDVERFWLDAAVLPPVPA
ncbi:response regulator [Halosimplex aquaticum]|uniref:Response regulator n=1 Tax=Halosimplex aquaticum TaxID=3026162 RepID=A0ABD5YD26_9EURY|nr:response regulator [Halosimplex aquaticum]